MCWKAELRAIRCLLKRHSSFIRAEPGHVLLSPSIIGALSLIVRDWRGVSLEGRAVLGHGNLRCFPALYRKGLLKAANPFFKRDFTKRGHLIGKECSSGSSAQ